MQGLPRDPFDSDVEKVCGVLHDALQGCGSPESGELLKPLLQAVFHQSGDPKKQQNDPSARLRVDGALNAFQMNTAVKKFIEKHQLIRLERLFALRATLNEHYERHRIDMGYESVFSLAKQKCDFVISDDLFTRFLHQMGFELHRVGSRNVVNECFSQRIDRLRYIREIQKHRESGKNTIYFQEKTIDFSRWNIHEGTNCEIHNSFTVLLAAGDSGLLNHKFVPALDQKEFTSYFARFMALQPPNSVVVFDARPYNVTKTSILTSSAILPSRGRALKLLNKSNISPASDDLPTIQLLEQLRESSENMEAHPDNELAKIIKDFKLETLRIPSNHPELNPLTCVDFHEMLSELPVELIDEEIFKEAMSRRLNAIGSGEWRRYFERVQCLENRFMIFEQLSDNDVIDVDLNGDDDSDVEILAEVYDVIQIDED